MKADATVQIKCYKQLPVTQRRKFNKIRKTANKFQKTSDKQVIELHYRHIMSISNKGTG